MHLYTTVKRAGHVRAILALSASALTLIVSGNAAAVRKQTATQQPKQPPLPAQISGTRYSDLGYRGHLQYYLDTWTAAKKLISQFKQYPGEKRSLGASHPMDGQAVVFLVRDPNAKGTEELTKAPPVNYLKLGNPVYFISNAAKNEKLNQLSIVEDFLKPDYLLSQAARFLDGGIMSTFFVSEAGKLARPEWQKIWGEGDWTEFGAGPPWEDQAFAVAKERNQQAIDRALEAWKKNGRKRPTYKVLLDPETDQAEGAVLGLPVDKDKYEIVHLPVRADFQPGTEIDKVLDQILDDVSKHGIVNGNSTFVLDQASSVSATPSPASQTAPHIPRHEESFTWAGPIKLTDGVQAAYRPTLTKLSDAISNSYYVNVTDDMFYLGRDAHFVPGAALFMLQTPELGTLVTGSLAPEKVKGDSAEQVKITTNTRHLHDAIEAKLRALAPFSQDLLSSLPTKTLPDTENREISYELGSQDDGERLVIRDGQPILRRSRKDGYSAFKVNIPPIDVRQAP